jgi:hypothetical protein
VKRPALLIASLLLLAGCASAPPTAARIEGHYRVRGEGWHAYEDITLRNGNFRWRYVTDGPPGPEPLTGAYSFEGNLVIFHHPLMPQPKRVLTQPKGVCLLWTVAQYNEYLRTGQTPLDVLYRTR